MSSPSGYNVSQVANLNPQQLNQISDMLSKLGGGGNGLDYLLKLAAGDEDIFKQIEAPAYQALEQGLAQTGNRFSQFGAQGSSAFQNALAGQSAQMGQNLAANRNQLMQSAIDKLLGLQTQLLGTKTHENVLEPKTNWEAIFGQFLGQLPGAAAKAYTGGLF